MCTVCMEKYTLGNKYFPLCTELVHGESILRRLGDKPSNTVYSLNISIENRERLHKCPQVTLYDTIICVVN